MYSNIPKRVCYQPLCCHPLEWTSFQFGRPQCRVVLFKQRWTTSTTSRTQALCLSITKARVRGHVITQRSVTCARQTSHLWKTSFARVSAHPNAGFKKNNIFSQLKENVFCSVPLQVHSSYCLNIVSEINNIQINKTKNT